MGKHNTEEATANVLPLTKPVCVHKVRHSARVCRSRQTQHQTNAPNPNPQLSANAIRVQSQPSSNIQLYNIAGNKANPAPTIKVHMSSSSGTRVVKFYQTQEQILYLGSRVRNPQETWPTCKKPAIIKHQPKSCKWNMHDTHREITCHNSIRREELYR